MRVYLVMAHVREDWTRWQDSYVLSAWDSEEKAQLFIDQNLEAVAAENEDCTVTLKIKEWQVG